MSSSRHFSGGRRPGKAPEKSNFAQTCNLLSQYIKEKGSLRDLNLEIGGKVESVEAIVKPGSSLASASTGVNSHSNNGKSAQPSPGKQPPMDQFAARSDSSAIVVEDASNKASTSKEAAKTEPKSAQLTIFYSGRILVFDDYPMEKVRDLVSVAKRSSSQMSYGILSKAYQEKAGPTLREGLPPRPHAYNNNKQPFGVSLNNFREGTSSIVNEAVASTSRSEELSPQPEANGSDLPIARRSSIHRFLEKRKDRAAVRGPYYNQEHPGPSTKDDEQLDLNILP
ncbi:jasmonate Zim-domain protein [Striga asiatica]|uniref:Protein TIFY n=1 Tax=Striga asiatica TaxID=4170 RepID=A0A5A7RB71_STRAF|nr:jasmonate Zim-domain protein [Striga asiatica]